MTLHDPKVGYGKPLIALLRRASQYDERLYARVEAVDREVGECRPRKKQRSVDSEIQVSQPEGIFEKGQLFVGACLVPPVDGDVLYILDVGTEIRDEL